MKKLTSVLALILMVCSLFICMACNETEPTDGKTVVPTTPTEVTKPTDKTEPTPGPIDPSTIEYSVKVEALSGKPLSGFYVGFYLDNEEVSYGPTKSDGIYKVNLEPNKYEVLVEANEGYILSEDTFETDLIGTQIVVTCDTELILSEAPAGTAYTQGDVMHDFTVTSVAGEQINLASLFDNGKQAVILNFWYVGCSWCAVEFPIMVEAYNANCALASETGKYSELIEIVAINPGTQDSASDILNYQQSMSIPFPMAEDYDIDPTNNISDEPALVSMFGVTGYPTTVVIDRYGTIAMIESGAITSLDKWVALFDEYISDDYTPQYVPGGANGEVVRPKPESTEIDSDAISAVVNGVNADGTNFEASYYPEPSEKDKEYSWPWVVSEDGDSMMPSNQDVHASYSIVYLDLYLEKDQVFAFDYFASCEEYDSLYIVVNREIATQISGRSSEWENSYAYVALEDGEYEIAFCYMKDKSTSMYDDTVYVKNLRIVDIKDIDKVTYIFREAAYGELNIFDKEYEHYITPDYNEEDGYYHVDSETGPLLLVDLLSSTKWSNNALYELTLDSSWLEVFPDGEYADVIEKYAQYASNSTIGYCPITEELKVALKAIVTSMGEEDAADPDKQWLELCVYYSAYGTNGVELSSPIVGVAPFEAIPFEKNEDNTFTASAVFDRVILPRGLIFSFTPEVSGVYKFSSIGSIEALGWVCDENGTVIKENEVGLREFAKESTLSTDGTYDPNFVSYEYYEAGKTYLLRAGFYDIYEFSQINVKIEYVADSVELLTIASPGFFTSSDDEMSDIISGNIIDAEIGNDGFYHVKDSKASDDFVYCDIIYLTNIFNGSIQNLIDRNGFDFTFDEYNNSLVDENGYYRIPQRDAEGNLIVDGDGNIQYDYVYDENGDRVIISDMTSLVKAYVDTHMEKDETKETYGCVKVDENFANVLQMLMDKYTFPGVLDSWLKLCYYYEYVGVEK